jgi:hypothetical protein
MMEDFNTKTVAYSAMKVTGGSEGLQPCREHDANDRVEAERKNENFRRVRVMREKADDDDTHPA